jgi:hypothetical protein
MINDLEFAFNRQAILFKEFRMDNTEYDEIFFGIIDKLISLKFGKDVAELINFYIYERFNPDGSSNYLLDPKGNRIELNTPEELWNLIITANPNLENS